MRAVNTISLNGNAWQIEAEGCDALAAYLKSAEARLTGDPDRTEILADLEQAIADKLARRVSAHKNVVTVEEIKLALQEMGPVEAVAPNGPRAEAGAQGTADLGSGSSASPDAGAAGAQGKQAAGDNAGAAGAGATRHLFRIREGEMVGGVCNGLAAYFGLDVTIVRLIFVLASVFSGGIGAVVYIVMMMVVPVAETAEQMAAAHGKPFSAEELIGRPKGPTAGFAAGHHWRQQWRDQSRVWRDQRRQWRRQRRAWGFGGPPYAPVPPPPPPYVGEPFIGVLRMVLLIVFLVALARAIEGRPLWGWDWAASVPHWVGIVAVCVVYGALMKQTHMAWYYGHVSAYHPGHALLALFGTVVWLLVLLALGWYAVHHWPEVQDFLQRLVLAVQGLFNNSASHNAIAA